MNIQHYRKVSKTITGSITTDGGGVVLKRIIGSRQLNMLDPFLLLDEFHSDKPDEYIAGFPDHPHRGFETVTYMLEGQIHHKDNAGHEGIISAGGIQWLTAGKGIIHSEMPEQKNGLLWGFQLWLNLPASEKMISSRYQEFEPDQIPVEVRDGNIIIRVIAGRSSNGTEGAVSKIVTQPLYMDVALPPNTEFIEPIPAENNAFIYVYTGEISVINSQDNDTQLNEGMLGILDDGDGVYIKASGTGARCLLLSARPLNEPIFRSGPFVMNSKEEIKQAFFDYQNGLF